MSYFEFVNFNCLKKKGDKITIIYAIAKVHQYLGLFPKWHSLNQSEKQRFETLSNVYAEMQNVFE